MDGNKLPKQLKHWIRSAGLKPRWWEVYRNNFRSNKDNLSLVGLGYYWMITDTGLIYRSCKIENFDRWANSTDYSLDIGGNKATFISRVGHLSMLREVNP